MEGQHIQGSPFITTAVTDLTTPINIINGLKEPWGIAISKDGYIAVSENEGHDISISSASGHKMISFGNRGSGPGELVQPRGVTFDGDGNILVADKGNNRIQKFSAIQLA